MKNILMLILPVIALQRALVSLATPRGTASNAYVPPVADYAPAYGSLVYFALDGDTVETETVSEADAPAGEVLTAWKELGCLEQGSIEVQAEGGREIFCFTPGSGHKKKRTVGETVRLIYNFTVQLVTPFILQMSRHAASVNPSTGAFTHGSQSEAHYLGYLLINQYNDGELVASDKVRAELRLANAMDIHARGGSTPQLTAEFIRNANNSGAFGTVTE